MEKDSALYQLMDTRMHSVMNGIVSSDGEYQAMLIPAISTGLSSSSLSSICK